MDASQRKAIKLGVIVVCLVTAGVVTWSWTSKSPTGIDTIDPAVMTWVKCRNPECEAEYEMKLKDYCRYVEENTDYSLMVIAALVCEKCEEESIYEAVKCEKCGEVFEKNTVPQDFEDRCPVCKHSKIENDRRRRREGGGAGGE